MIQFVDIIVISNLEPFPEGRVTEIAVAISPVVFIGRVPDKQRRMILVPLGEFRVDDPAFLPIDRRGAAVVVAARIR